MDNLDIYTLKQLLLYCPNSITHIGSTCKYYHNFMMSDSVLRGLYYAPTYRSISLNNVLKYFKGIDVLNLQESTNFLRMHDRSVFIYAKIYAILTNNIEYLIYLRNIYVFEPKDENIFNDLLIYIALANNKSNIIKQFFDISKKSKYKLAEMAYISMKYLDSLKYILSFNHTAYVTEHPYYIWNFSKWKDFEDKRCYSEVTNNYYEIKQRELSIVKLYVAIIIHGSIKCANIIYNLLPKNFITHILVNNDKLEEPQLYENTRHVDELLENLKFVHDLGYVFTSEEFDEASREDNVETLKYLISIDVEFTDLQIKRWLRNPRCRAYLEKNEELNDDKL